METGGIKAPERLAKDSLTSYIHKAIWQYARNARRVVRLADDKKKSARPDEDLAPEASALIPEDEFDKTWKPEPHTEAKLNHRGFRFSFGISTPPRKPDGEPYQ